MEPTCNSCLFGFIEVSDLIGSFIGALAGFLGAYWLFRKERASTKNDEHELLQAQFANIQDHLGNAHEAWLRMIMSYRALSTRYAKDPHRTYPRPVSVNAAHITLDRMNRDDVMDAFLECTDANHAGNDANLLLDVIDTMREYRTLAEEGVLSMMGDFNQHGRRFSDHCRELKYAVMEYALLHANSILNDKPSVIALKQIAETVRDLGRVEASAWYAVMVKPVAEQIHQEDIGFKDWSRFMSIVDKANSAYWEMKASGVELAEHCASMAKGMEDEISDVPALLSRMERAVRGKGN
jgi:hypothetical protein